MTSKLKISVTVSSDVLALVDRAATATGTTRSGMIDSWLRQSATRAAERSVDDATAAYYASLRTDAAEEHAAIAHASSRTAARVIYDESEARAHDGARSRARSHPPSRPPSRPR